MTAAVLVKALGGRHGMARCPAHDDHTPSLSVSDGRDGKVLFYCHAGCDQAGVWVALKDRGLVGNGDARNRAPNSRPGGWRTGPRATVGTDRFDPDAEAKTAFAKKIWAEGREAAGTPVEHYLRTRGLTIDPPATLRYHPGLKHGPTGLFLPAMVAAVTTWPSRAVVAVHRTFITATGTGKAPVTSPKMMLGRCAGGAVRLAPAGEVLILAEGIETALSVQAANGCQFRRRVDRLRP
jgi:hypothetical protein